MLSNALHTWIEAIFAHIFGRLEQIFLLWQAGNLPTPPPRHPQRGATPEIRRAQPCAHAPTLPNAGWPKAGTLNPTTPESPTTVANTSHAQRRSRRRAPTRDRRLPAQILSAPAVRQTPSLANGVAIPAPHRQARAPPPAAPLPAALPSVAKHPLFGIAQLRLKTLQL